MYTPPRVCLLSAYGHNTVTADKEHVSTSSLEVCKPNNQIHDAGPRSWQRAVLSSASRLSIFSLRTLFRVDVSSKQVVI